MTREHDFSAHHFLVADDKPFIRKMIYSMLSMINAKDVLFATSGESALHILSKPNNNIDCLLCDWNMEPINGLQVLSRIRCGAVNGAARDLRVIMLTAHANESLVVAAMALDVNGYIVKPVATEKLAAAIGDAFSKPFILKLADVYAEVKVAAVPASMVLNDERIVQSAWVRRANEKHQQIKDAATETRQGSGSQSGEKKSQDELRPIRNKRWRALDIVKPGVFLADDIVSKDGRVLLIAGVELTPRLLARLESVAAEAGSTFDILIGDR